MTQRLQSRDADAMRWVRLKLSRTQRIQYFAPVAFCGYIVLICSAMIVTAQFLSNPRAAAEVSASASFGLLLSVGLGASMLTLQLRELRYRMVRTRSEASQNFAAVRRLFGALDWKIIDENPDRRLDARTPDFKLQEGDIVAVRFEHRAVWVASICDPSVGFSMLGRERCRENRALVERAVLGMPC